MGKRINYSQAELKWIKENCTLPRKDALEKFCKLFSRNDVQLQHYNALCKRNGWMTGRTGQYVPEQTPYNKGKKMPYNGNSARTQFKKGQKPHNTKFLGHERITKDGYIEVSVDSKNPHTGFERQYVLKHRYVWEQKNGRLPKGFCLKCLDGNKLNTDPSNWEAIDRAVLVRLNQMDIDYETAPMDAKPVILNIAKLKTVVGSKKKSLA